MARRESRKARLARMHEEYRTLCEFIPVVKCQLDFHNPYELIVCTVLSAQCTDKRVNETTPELFGAYPTPEALADAVLEDVEEIIRPLGFYHVKSEHIIALARGIVEQYGGEVPHTMEELTTLPGVGRKTANVVLGNAFGIPGFPVDTHVIRVTGRLRWRDDWDKPNPDPERIHDEITACFPPDEWTDLSHRLIIFGRVVCTARNPDCPKCPLRDTCPTAPQFLAKYAEKEAMEAAKRRARAERAAARAARQAAKPAKAAKPARKA
ncbi:MAG: endonuclease III [Bifidobacterium sp.]|nr:endonuclease III [Bifidobacterium sp.]